MTAPASGFASRACCSLEYSSSDKYSCTRRVNSLVSTKLIIRQLYGRDVLRQCRVPSVDGPPHISYDQVSPVEFSSGGQRYAVIGHEQPLTPPARYETAAYASSKTAAVDGRTSGFEEDSVGRGSPSLLSFAAVLRCQSNLIQNSLEARLLSHAVVNRVNR